MHKPIKMGAYVVYGKMGVCCVEDKQKISFGGSAEDYYVLRPMSDGRSAVYVPCDNETLVERMRPLLTRGEIESLLGGLEGESLQWIEDRNERQLALREVLAQGDRRQLLLLIRCLYEKKQEKIAGSKRLSSADEKLLHEAIRLLEEEFAVALQIPREGVAEYIRSCLGECRK